MPGLPIVLDSIDSAVWSRAALTKGPGPDALWTATMGTVSACVTLRESLQGSHNTAL